MAAITGDGSVGSVWLRCVAGDFVSKTVVVRPGCRGLDGNRLIEGGGLDDWLWIVSWPWSEHTERVSVCVRARGTSHCYLPAASSGTKTKASRDVASPRLFSPSCQTNGSNFCLTQTSEHFCSRSSLRTSLSYDRLAK
jgi:hypothetical protein